MEKSFIYCIRASDGRIKIGISDKPESRLAQMQTAHAEVLSILWTVSVSKNNAKFIERSIHNELTSFHVRGEWFNVCPDFARRIAEENRALKQPKKPARSLTPVPTQLTPIDRSPPSTEEIRVGGNEESVFISRGWTDHPVFTNFRKDPVSPFGALLWLLDHAEPEKNIYTMVTKISLLAERWRWSQSRVRKYLNRLTKSNQFGVTVDYDRTCVKIVITWMYEHVYDIPKKEELA